MKPYEILNTETGEITNPIKYIIGRPADYRFDGQQGIFKYGAETILTDEKGKTLKEFSFTPIAWRVFEENLFGRGKKDTWVELFFIDEKKRVSHIMLNNSSTKEFLSLATELFYEDCDLSEVVLTLTPFKIESDKTGQKLTWYATKCTFVQADKETVAALKDYTQDFHIYAERTLTSTAVYRFKSESFYIPDEFLQLQEAI